MLKKFLINFFSNIKAEIKENDNVLIVDKVPKEFESYYGKKAPYYFVFDREAEGEEEKIDKGSQIIKLISDYLSNKGQIGLVKIDFNATKEDILRFIKFRNCELSSISKKPEYKFFIRFTFQTTFQYLNEREQVINSIFVDNDKLIDFIPDKYDCVEGKKQELEIGDIKKEYAIAKEELKKIIAPKINKIGDVLTKKLDKEIERIKDHFKAQTSEKSISMKDALKFEDERIKLEKEEQFFLKDEEHKHGLNVSTNILNTTIFYYPIFKIDLWIKNNDVLRKEEVTYSPFAKQLFSVPCSSCKTELDEIFLCSSGHAVCKKCLGKCKECGKGYCLNCLNKICSYCNNKICSKCCIKCLRCGKYYCLGHIKKDNLSGKYSCINCIKKCFSCNAYCEKTIKCSCGREFCEKCSPSGKFCKYCSKKCSLCGNYREFKDFERCKMCKAELCNYAGKCRNCRQQLCIKFKG
jgi:hypothetical protein